MPCRPFSDARPSVAGIAIEGWAAEYGAPVDVTPPGTSDTQVDISVECPPQEWRPLSPHSATSRPPLIYFVDGVRRVEARMWITDETGETRTGLAASYGAGIACCVAGRARILAAEVRRGFFARAGVPRLDTAAGRFVPSPVADDDTTTLMRGPQRDMSRLEATVAERVRTAAALTILDGPLRDRHAVAGAIGYVKTHRVQYLPEQVRRVVGALEPGRRTPVFFMQGVGNWSRYSWYLRLPGGSGHPWAGVVRCEARHETGLDEVRRLADTTALVLPTFASEPHKDPRAPQNLYPIAGLERELHHRLGDTALIYRALARAVSRIVP